MFFWRLLAYTLFILGIFLVVLAIIDGKMSFFWLGLTCHIMSAVILLVMKRHYQYSSSVSKKRIHDSWLDILFEGIEFLIELSVRLFIDIISSFFKYLDNIF